MTQRPRRKPGQPEPLLPERFGSWFEAAAGRRGRISSALLAKAREGRSVLLVAPTGAGKTLAGFLPSLVELSERGPDRGTAKDKRGLHTLYISPLKALAVDIARNLETPVRRDGRCRSASRPAPATRPRTSAPGRSSARRTSC